MLDVVQYVLGGLSGSLVGLSLGLFGGGGSILAVPLMVYLVGVPGAHVAIGTSALAVAANAGAGLVGHARRGNVIWRCALMFSVAGIAGATLGSMAGKALDGQKLLFLFALIMIVVGFRMLKGRGQDGAPGTRCTREKVPKVLAAGGATGLLSGFFGIGGGFLIVPGLIASTGMPILNAIGSSLVAVAAFGVTTAMSYAFSGLVDWPLAAVFIAGGIAGSATGSMMAQRLSARKGVLNVGFAILVFAVAAYMLWQSGQALLR
ncbi:sulfite exporter TauE/SafE family protein [Afipia sp. TerB]